MIHGHIQHLLSELRRWTGESVGWIGPKDAAARGPFLCLQGTRAYGGQQIFEALKARGIFTALRNGRVRIAPHLLHTADDMARVSTILREIVNHG